MKIIYDSKILATAGGIPKKRFRCKDNQTVDWWLPLKQDWSRRWCILPESYNESYADRIHNFETRVDDVFVVTFPKCGTTWMQELAWLLLNQLDYQKAKQSYVLQRSIYLEYSAFNALHADTIKACDEMTSPRLIKSHLPAQLLPIQIWQQGHKVIYVARNLKDTILSYYHFCIGLGRFDGSLEVFIDEFVKDEIAYGSYWSHLIDFWRMRDEPNIFFVTYEEMKRDLKGVIERLIKFLGVREIDGKEMEELLKHLSFESMKGNKFSNLTGLLKQNPNTRKGFEFMRRGVVGSYKDELTAEQIEKLNKWTNEVLKEYEISESDIFSEI